MKKLLALVLALAMVMGLAACGSQGETTAAPTQPAQTEAPTTKAPETTPPATEAPTTKAPETQPTTEAPVEYTVTTGIQLLNPVLKGLEAIKDPENTRYQAYWLNGYGIGKIAEENFWFEMTDETAVQAVSYNDGYTAEMGNFALMKDQAICLDVPEGLQKNFADGILIGTGFKRDDLPWQMGWVTAGPEVMLIVPADGYETQYLFEDLNMVEADSYDFICGGPKPYTEEIDKEDLEKVNIYFSEAGLAVADSVAWEGYTLDDLLYIVPHGLTAENAAEFELEEGKTAKITVVNTIANYAEPDFFGPSGGTVQTGYKVSDILEALMMNAPVETVKAISFGDGSNKLHAATEIDYNDFVQRYFVPEDDKGRGGYTVGRTQVYGDVTINVGCYVLDEDVLLYVPESAADKETGIALLDILNALGIEFKAVSVVCSDGFSEIITKEDLEGIKIYHSGENVDVDSFAYAPYTLMDVETIQILN